MITRNTWPFLPFDKRNKFYGTFYGVRTVRTPFKPGTVPGLNSWGPGNIDLRIFQIAPGILRPQNFSSHYTGQYMIGLLRFVSGPQDFKSGASANFELFVY